MGFDRDSEVKNPKLISRFLEKVRNVSKLILSLHILIFNFRKFFIISKFSPIYPLSIIWINFLRSNTIWSSVSNISFTLYLSHLIFFSLPKAKTGFQTNFFAPDLTARTNVSSIYLICLSVINH